MQIRKVPPTAWNDFVKDWVLYHWTWIDPNTGKTCEKCGWAWAKWRIWLFEMMEYTEDIKDMLLKWRSPLELENHALKMWMINLERDAILKALWWKVAIDEVYRLVKHKDFSY
jgi:type II secretory ATPase GspE/PulE/Tfp pilus assembly ATPase PilB-like protein